MWRALDLAISNAESQLEKTSKDVNEVRNRFREQRLVLSSLQFQRDRLPDFNNVVNRSPIYFLGSAFRCSWTSYLFPFSIF